MNCIHPTPDEPDFETAEQLYIDPGSCIECGACVDVCPVSAIYPDYEMPDGADTFVELNANFYEDDGRRDYPGTPFREAKITPPQAIKEPLRVAVVGSGPAASYFVEECVSTLGRSVEVNLFERLPVLGGLVRHGIAPDHQDTKLVWDRFAASLRAANVELFLNCEVGKDITHEQLLEHHHAVVYATGAQSARSVDVPGKDLPGCTTAEDLISWYNGHPDYAHLAFDLSHERAVVIGNGNVALDVARILTAPIDELRKTDIADHALEVLANSNVREVVIVGRRGPAQAAFSAGELLGLARMNSAALVCRRDDFEIGRPLSTDRADSTHEQRFKAQFLSGLRDSHNDGKTITFRFGLAPAAIRGHASVEAIDLNRLEPHDENETIEWRPSGRTETFACGLVVSCIGYHGTPLAGLPYDPHTQRIPNNSGRVTAETPTRTYLVGWAKSGAMGGVGRNRRCARETLQAILSDHEAGLLAVTPSGQDSLHVALAGHPTIDRAGWLRIDARERANGRPHQRPRVKFATIQAMLAAASSESTEAVEAQAATPRTLQQEE